MSGTLIAYRWELRKLRAQKRTWLGLAAAVVTPIIFLISIQISAVQLHPPDGPYADPLGLNLRHTGLALNLVVLKEIAIVGPAILAALVGGDIVAGEDGAGTLKTILTRSLRRGQVLAGKAMALFTYVIAALVAYTVAGTVAGVVAWGFNPLNNLSGDQISAARTLGLSILAMAIYGLPVLALASFGLFVSVLTLNGVTAVTITLLYAVALQGLEHLSAIASAQPYLLYHQLSAWHDLFHTPTAGDAIVRSVRVSALFGTVPLVAAWIVFRRRDVTT